MGVLLLTLVATMTLFVAQSDVVYAQTPDPSDDADLEGLVVTGSPNDAMANDLLPDNSDFATTTMYTVRIPYVDSGVDITATAKDNLDGGDQTIKVNRTTVTSGTAHTVTGIASGTITTINIEVTAPAGNKKVYTVKVYRERSPKSPNANLRSLGLAGVSLSPAFSSGTTSYKARVQASTVTVSYSLSDTAGGASAAIIAPDSGVTGMEVTLANAAAEGQATGGTTTITVMVTPESIDVASVNNCLTTAGIKCYTIEVYRIRANESDNATLTGLTLAPVGGVRVDRVGSVTNFTAAVTDYTDRMDNATTQVTVDATLADAGASLVISPSDADSNTPDHQVSLTAGAERTITVRVTAEDPEVTKTYTVKVYRNRNTLSEEAMLSRLSLSDGALDPSFRRATLEYDVRVGPDVEDVTVSYATVDTAGAASVVVTAVAVDEQDGTDAGPITLLQASPNEIPLQVAGMATRIKVTVTPEAGLTNADDDSITKQYIITIYRVRTAPSADATLIGLMLNSTAVADFASTTKMYNVTVENDTSSVTVVATATREDKGATIDISPASPVDLAAGRKTMITITVTAEDGVTTDEYMVYVYRNRALADESDDATLSALSLSDGTLSPAFLSDRMEYTARVGNDVDKVTVSYTPTDNAGGVTVNVSSGATADDPTAGCAVDAGDEVDLLIAGSNTIISLCVTPEAGATPDTNLEVYQITVYRMRSNPSPDTDLETFEITDASSAPTSTKFGTETAVGPLTLRDGDAPDVGYRVRSVTVNVGADVGAVVEIMPEDSDNGMMGHQIVLAAGEETMISVTVTPEDSAADPRTYTANVYRQNVNLSDDATLSSLILSGVTLMYKDDNDMDMTGFMSDVMDYTGDAGSEKTTVTAMASHLGAQSGVTVFYGPDNDEAMLGDDGGYEITVGEVDDDISITVQVIAESVTEASPTCETTNVECYTIEVTRAEEGGTLLSRYDNDNSGDIDLSEVSAAIDDYFSDDLTLAEVSAVIDLYFG